MKVKWCVNTYMDIDGKRKRVEKVSFGNNYENASGYYIKHKAEERKQGRYLELKPYKY